MKRLLYTLLLAPSAYILLRALVWCFYVCELGTFLYFLLGASFVLAWFGSARMISDKNPGKLVLLLVFINTLILLSVIVLFGLSDDRHFGSYSSSAKQTLGNVRSGAEFIYLQNNESYATVCEAESILKLLTAVESNIQKIEKMNCNGFVTDLFFKEKKLLPVKSTCVSSQDSYELQVYVPAYDLYWCVSSDGSIKLPHPSDELMSEDLCTPMD